MNYDLLELTENEIKQQSAAQTLQLFYINYIKLKKESKAKNLGLDTSPIIPEKIKVEGSNIKEKFLNLYAQQYRPCDLPRDFHTSLN